MSQPRTSPVEPVAENAVRAAVAVEIAHGNDVPGRVKRTRDVALLRDGGVVHDPRRETASGFFAPDEVGAAVGIEVASSARLEAGRIERGVAASDAGQAVHVPQRRLARACIEPRHIGLAVEIEVVAHHCRHCGQRRIKLHMIDRERDDRRHRDGVDADQILKTDEQIVAGIVRRAQNLDNHRFGRRIREVHRDGDGRWETHAARISDHESNAGRCASQGFRREADRCEAGSNGSQLPIVRLFPVAPLPSSEASSASTELPRLTERISVDPLAIVIPGWGRPSKFSTNSVAAGKVLSAVER